MDAEKLRLLLVSLIPGRMEDKSRRMFFEHLEYAEHQAEVDSWNKCRDAMIEKANKVYQDALKAEEAV